MVNIFMKANNKKKEFLNPKWDLNYKVIKKNIFKLNSQ
jgi:hypothetical protein